jgi:hypothetical protein
MRKGLGDIEKRINRKHYKCLLPGCDEVAIKSHSQQKERQLRSIARAGKVYALHRNYYQAFKLKDFNSPSMMRLHGVGEASTFPGFCQKHDAEIFKRIDQELITAHDKEQAFLLFLRSISYEYGQKRRSIEWNMQVSELMEELGNEEAARMVKTQAEGKNVFLKIDAPHYFEILWEAFESRSYDCIESCWLQIPKNIGLSSSCMFSPIQERKVRYAQLSSDDPQPVLNFNMIPFEGETFIVTSWLSEHSEMASWVHEITVDSVLAEQFIHQAAFEESEDTCINPDLWEALNVNVQTSLVNAMRHELSRGPIQSLPVVFQISKTSVNS